MDRRCDFEPAELRESRVPQVRGTSSGFFRQATRDTCSINGYQCERSLFNVPVATVALVSRGLNAICGLCTLQVGAVWLKRDARQPVTAEPFA